MEDEWQHKDGTLSSAASDVKRGVCGPLLSQNERQHVCVCLSVPDGNLKEGLAFSHIKTMDGRPGHNELNHRHQGGHLRLVNYKDCSGEEVGDKF